MEDAGQILGAYDYNPILNSIFYYVIFLEGAMKQYSANVIAESIYYTVNGDGNSQHVLESILDHSKDGCHIFLI